MSVLIHCTQKLLAQIPDRFIDPSASGASWHANLLRFDRRKCVLFTHDETLYSVFVPGLRKPEFEQLDEVFGQRLFKALVWDGLSQTQIERMLEACREIRFTRSSNRSVLGSMNDMRFQIGAQVEQDGGLTSVDLAQLHHALNRTWFGNVLPPVVLVVEIPGRPKFPTILENLGDHLRARRHELGLTQRQAATILGVNRVTLWCWENHRTEPEIGMYPRLVNFLGYCPLPLPQIFR